MELTISHFIAFLIGVLAGISGLFWGAKYLKKRDEEKTSSRLENNFEKASNLMPTFIKEIRTDIKNDESKAVREFVVLPTTKHSSVDSKGRFVYYEDQYEDLREYLDILERSGFILKLASGNTLAYKLSDEFVDLLKGEFRDT